MSDFFSLAFVGLRLSTRKPKLKKNSDDVHRNVWTNIKKLCPRNNIFKKEIPNMRF